MNKPVLIIGSAGTGRAAMEIFTSNQVLIYGFIEDDKNIKEKEVHELTILGTTEDESLIKLIGKDCDVFVATDDKALHKSYIKMLKAKRTVVPVNAVHRSAVVADTVVMGHGVLVDMGVLLGAEVELGNYTILHSGASISYGTTIGNYVQMGTGVSVGPGAKIEDEAFIGAGSVIVSGITVGKGARVGAGSVVVADVAAGKTVFGNPAKEINA